MVMQIHIDDDKYQTYTLSVLLLDEALQHLIKNDDLDKEKLAQAIDKAKDNLLKLNQNNDDYLAKMSLMMNANTLQCRYLEL